MAESYNEWLERAKETIEMFEAKERALSWFFDVWKEIILTELNDALKETLGKDIFHFSFMWLKDPKEVDLILLNLRLYEEKQRWLLQFSECGVNCSFTLPPTHQQCVFTFFFNGKIPVELEYKKYCRVETENWHIEITKLELTTPLATISYSFPKAIEITAKDTHQRELKGIKEKVTALLGSEYVGLHSWIKKAIMVLNTLLEDFLVGGKFKLTKDKDFVVKRITISPPSGKLNIEYGTTYTKKTTQTPNYMLLICDLKVEVEVIPQHTQHRLLGDVILRIYPTFKRTKWLSTIAITFTIHGISYLQVENGEKYITTYLGINPFEEFERTIYQTLPPPQGIVKMKEIETLATILVTLIRELLVGELYPKEEKEG